MIFLRVRSPLKRLEEQAVGVTQNTLSSGCREDHQRPGGDADVVESQALGGGGGKVAGPSQV